MNGVAKAVGLGVMATEICAGTSAELAADPILDTVESPHEPDNCQSAGPEDLFVHGTVEPLQTETQDVDLTSAGSGCWGTDSAPVYAVSWSLTEVPADHPLPVASLLHVARDDVRIHEAELLDAYQAAVEERDGVLAISLLRQLESLYRSKSVLLTRGGLAGMRQVAGALKAWDAVIAKERLFERFVVRQPDGRLLMDYKPRESLPLTLRAPDVAAETITLPGQFDRGPGVLRFHPIEGLGVTQEILSEQGVGDYLRRLATPFRYAEWKKQTLPLRDLRPASIFIDNAGRVHLDDGHHRAMAGLRRGDTHLLTESLPGVRANVTPRRRLSDLRLVSVDEHQAVMNQQQNRGTGYGDLFTP